MVAVMVGGWGCHRYVDIMIDTRGGAVVPWQSSGPKHQHGGSVRGGEATIQSKHALFRSVKTVPVRIAEVLPDSAVWCGMVLMWSQGGHAW